MGRKLKLNDIPTSCRTIFRYFSVEIPKHMIMKENIMLHHVGYNKFTRHDSSAHYVVEKHC